MTEEELIKLSTIHEVLSAGDDILKAQVLLKNATQTLVNYASEKPAVMYQEHTRIVETLLQTISELDGLVETEDSLFMVENINLLDD